MLHRGWICGHCVTPWYTVWHTVTMRDIIWGINQSSIEGMNKITYTKHCEFCGTEFTTPIHSRRYCSKSCVRAAYNMRLKEKRKSDAAVRAAIVYSLVDSWKPRTLIHVNGWRMSCSGYPGTRITVKPSVNSCLASGENKTTKINFIQHGSTWASCLQLELKYASCP